MNTKVFKDARNESVPFAFLWCLDECGDVDHPEGDCEPQLVVSRRCLVQLDRVAVHCTLPSRLPQPRPPSPARASEANQTRQGRMFHLVSRQP